MLYELRIYDTVPGKLPALHERFTNVTLPLFKKHGIGLVGFWTDEVGVSNRLTYIISFRDMAHREQAWNAFQSDPDWIKGRAESEKNGPINERIYNTFLKPTIYSPLQ